VRPPFTFYTVLRLTLWLDTSLRLYAIPQSQLPLPSTYDISTYFRPSYTPSDLLALSYYVLELVDAVRARHVTSGYFHLLYRRG
jgi:hypothetical protein